MSPALDQIHARVRRNRWLNIFTVVTRILLALAFLPSGITKVMGNRFTVLGIDNPVGFFFEALYRSGFYWRFLGICQLAVALLLLIPKTATLGALDYFPLIPEYFCDYGFASLHGHSPNHWPDVAGEHLSALLGICQTKEN